MEHILQPGDACRDCQRVGLTKHLRYFYINLEEQILKCESNSCLYPFDSEHDNAIDSPSNDAEAPIFTDLQGGPDPAQNCSVYFIEELFEDLPTTTTKLVATTPENAPVDNSNVTNCKAFKTEKLDNIDNSTCVSVIAKPAAIDNKLKIEKFEFIEKKCRKKKCIKRAFIKTETAASNCNSSALVSNTSSDDIPKARISRFLAAISGPKVEPKRKPALAKKYKSLKHQIIIKNEADTSESESEIGVSNMARPLDYLQQFLGNKSIP